MNHKNILFSLLFLLIYVSINAQTRIYDIVLFGDIVGEITSNKKTISETEYELSYISKAEAKVLFINTKTFTEAKINFKNDFVQLAYILRKKNNETTEINIKRNDEQYVLDLNGNISYKSEKITFCTTNLFFEEPIGIKKVFVERLLTYVDIENLGNHQYQTVVDGSTNTYTYKNGVLNSLKSIKGITIYMKLR